MTKVSTFVADRLCCNWIIQSCAPVSIIHETKDKAAFQNKEIILRKI